jgi:putative inorganic carbon (hco3(-)) transporter
LLWITLVITLLAIAWGWKNPRFLLPLLILALPLEISREWFPHLSVLDKLGEYVGVIYFGRILTLAVIGYFFWSLVRPKGSGYYNINAWDSLLDSIRSPVFLALSAYLIWGAISVLWSVDPTRSLVGVARLGLLWFLGVAVFDLVRRQEGYDILPLSFSIVSSGLGLIGIYEILTRKFIFLPEIYELSGRANATFVDANIYARFLMIGILATVILMLGSSVSAWLIGGFSLLIQGVALLGTGSRTAWLAMVLILFALAVLIPRKPVIFSILGGLILTGTGILMKPEYLQRILEIKENFGAALTQRQYLITSGIEMFKDNPLIGVGLSGFQKVMLTRFPDLIQNDVSLSHTSLITTAAELGIIGLGILGIFLALLYSRLPRMFRAQRLAHRHSIHHPMSYQVIFGVLAVTAIFLSSQGEGRFFEDPYLWILIGYLTAIRDTGEVS